MIKELKSQTGQRANPEICSRKNPAKRWARSQAYQAGSTVGLSNRNWKWEGDRERKSLWLLPSSRSPPDLPPPLPFAPTKGEASRHKGLQSTACLPGTSTSTAPASQLWDGPLRPRDSIRLPAAAGILIVHTCFVCLDPAYRSINSPLLSFSIKHSECAFVSWLINAKQEMLANTYYRNSWSCAHRLCLLEWSSTVRKKTFRP